MRAGKGIRLGPAMAAAEPPAAAVPPAEAAPAAAAAAVLCPVSKQVSKSSKSIRLASSHQVNNVSQ